MKRLFGAKKEKPPPPSLSDAVGALEGRGDSIEARIAKLDAQLGKYKAQIKKMRPGPAQQGVKRRALQVSPPLSPTPSFSPRLPPPPIPPVSPPPPPPSFFGLRCWVHAPGCGL